MNKELGYINYIYLMLGLGVSCFNGCACARSLVMPSQDAYVTMYI